MQAAPISRAESLALVRQFGHAAARHDIPRLMDFYAGDAVAISPVFGEVRGKEAIAATWETLFSTFSDFALEVSDVLVDGDRIVILGKVTTTDRSGWFGLPATGGTIDYRLALLLTLADGKIVRDERIYDSGGVLERLEKARVDQELKTAAEVQRALLFRTFHTGRFFESAGNSVPCRAIGGDFFEFVELPSGDVGIALGDIAGRGPAAALLAAMIQGMFATEAASGDDPGVILSRMNKRLVARGLDERFATLIYAVLSPDGRLVYSNAGHPAPALLGRERIRYLTRGGPILGALDDARFEQESFRLQNHDTVVMFTDGVTEARNAQEEEFGERRLAACFNTDVSSAPSNLLLRIFTAVHEFCGQTEQKDDITVTVTRFHSEKQD